MKKVSRFHSIRFTLTFVVAALILLSVFASALLSYSQYTKSFQKQSSGQIDQTLDQLSINLNTYLEELFRMTTYLYYNSDVVSEIEETGGTSMDRLQRRRIIESYLDEILIMPRNDILNVFVITDEIYFSSRMPKSLEQNPDYSKYDWYQKAMEDQRPIYVAPHTEQMVSNPKDTVFSIVKQLRSVQNLDEILGVIKVDASYSGIENIAEKISLGEDGGIFIIDDNKNTIYSSVSQEKTEALADSVLNTSGSRTVTISSEEYLINTKTVEDAGWTIVAVNSLNELMENARQTRNFSFVFAMLCSLCAILILLLFTHNFLAPLNNIVSLMKEVRRGNFKVSFSSRRDDEIGYLGDSFNEMVKTIDQNIKKNTELATKIYETEMLYTEAKLCALQSQINPHFLYNTLNMISMQIQIGQQNQAVDNINKLHFMLRGMAQWDKEVLIEHEFAMIDSYLGIQSNRFSNRLTYELQLDDRIKKQTILSFILQPLVENAVIHGCEPLRRQTKIIVRGCTKKGSTHIVIYDNGCGMSKETLYALKKELEGSVKNEGDNVPKSRHIGLENVNKRIKLRYGTQYGIHVSSQKNFGTAFDIELPLLERSDTQNVPNTTG